MSARTSVNSTSISSPRKDKMSKTKRKSRTTLVLLETNAIHCSKRLQLRCCQFLLKFKKRWPLKTIECPKKVESSSRDQWSWLRVVEGKFHQIEEVTLLHQVPAKEADTILIRWIPIPRTICLQDRTTAATQIWKTSSATSTRANGSTASISVTSCKSHHWPSKTSWATLPSNSNYQGNSSWRRCVSWRSVTSAWERSTDSSTNSKRKLVNKRLRGKTLSIGTEKQLKLLFRFCQVKAL